MVEKGRFGEQFHRMARTALLAVSFLGLASSSVPSSRAEHMRLMSNDEEFVVEIPDASDQMINQFEVDLQRVQSALNIDEAHAIGATGEGIIIHVIDTGVGYQEDHINRAESTCHSTTTQQDPKAISICQNGEAFDDSYGAGNYCPPEEIAPGTHQCDHGDASAFRVLEVAPGAKIISHKIGMLYADDGKKYRYALAVDHVKEAIQYVIAEAKKTPGLRQILTMSAGTIFTYEGLCNDAQPAYAEISQNAIEAGLLQVYANGNGKRMDQDSIGVSVLACLGFPPTESDSIFSVAGLNKTFDGVADTSGHSPETTQVGAPGTHIPVVTSDGRLKYYDGTSVAAPSVAGIAALVWGVNANALPSQIEFRINQTATPIKVDFQEDWTSPQVTYTVGAVNAGKAVLREFVDVHSQDALFIPTVPNG